jgi:hypothetical protein
LALAAVAFLAVATQSHAQSSGGLTFVPVDTTKNLAAPLPVYPGPQTQGSYFDQLYNALTSILPFTQSSQPNMPGHHHHGFGHWFFRHQQPQPMLPSPQLPTTTLPGTTTLPQSPSLLNGTIR